MIAATDNKLWFVLGTDLFAPAGTKLREVLVQNEKSVISAIVEVGLEDSGKLFQLPLNMGRA